MIRKMVEYNSDHTPNRNEKEILVGQGRGTNSPNCLYLLRSLRTEVKFLKENNERLVRAQEKQVEINVVILQSLSNLQR